jgi:hypothetical protein
MKKMKENMVIRWSKSVISNFIASLFISLFSGLFVMGLLFLFGSDLSAIFDEGVERGFFFGFIQGMLVPCIMLFKPLFQDLEIYSAYNQGAIYDFGYFFGLICLFTRH